MKRLFKATVTHIASPPSATSSATAFSTSPKKALREARGKAEDLAISRGSMNWGGDWGTLTNPYGKIILSDFV
jgi:hypothetical protein